jgi:hypothetical protein
MTRYIGDSNVPLIGRLLSKVVVNQVTDCWEWIGGKNNIGYGLIRDGDKMRSVHRVSYEEHSNKKIPIGLVVMHSCDNKKCVNPAHLSVGTHKDNSQDMVQKGRHNVNGLFSMTGRKQPKKICPHCNGSIPANIFGKSHGDKCKLKP